MNFQVLDPTPGTAPPAGKLAPRLDTLEGKTVGFVSNGKEGTKGFFRHLERMLKDDYGVAKVVLRTKTNYSAPADARIADEMKDWDAVISGLGD
jgi:hypothetical protein